MSLHGVYLIFGAALPCLFTADSHAIILLAALLLAGVQLLRRQAIPKSAIALFPLCLALAVSGVVAGGPSIWSSAYVAGQILSWIGFAAVMSGERHATAFIYGLMMGIPVFVLANLLAIYGGPIGVRHAGLFPNANGLAAASTSLFVVSHLLQTRLASSDHFRLRLLSVGGQAGLLLLALLSGSRAGLLSIVIYFSAYGLFALRSAVKSMAVFVLAAPIVYLIGGDFLREALIFQRLETAAVEFFSGRTTADLEVLEVSERLNLANLAFEGWKSSPLIGNGVGTFRDISGYAYAHNAYADLLFSVGVFGVLAYFGFLFFLVLQYYQRRHKHSSVGFLPALVFIISYSFFIPTHQLLPFALVFGYLMSFPGPRPAVCDHV